MKWLLLIALAFPIHAQRLTPVDDAGYPKLVAAQKGKVVLVNFWPPGASRAARRCPRFRRSPKNCVRAVSN